MIDSFYIQNYINDIKNLQFYKFYVFQMVFFVNLERKDIQINEKNMRWVIKIFGFIDCF